MMVMSNINGQYAPVLQQNTAQQMNDKMKSQQQQQVILQQVSLSKIKCLNSKNAKKNPKF